MPIAGATIPLNTAEGEDKLTVTEKVTSAYFSDGATELSAGSITSESLSNDNEKYYFGISNTATATTSEFDVTYGNAAGSGSNTDGGNIKGATEVIYKQLASLLLPPTEVSGGFFISANKTTAANPLTSVLPAGTRDKEIYALIARRSNMKDRLNKKNWTLVLSGSGGAPLGSNLTLGPHALHLTDDSNISNPIATPAGDRYNIVSGSDGNVGIGAGVNTYGFYYADQGILLFSQQELSASIPGASGSHEDPATAVAVDDQPVRFASGSHVGFAASSNSDKNYNTALRFVNVLMASGSSLKFRDEEDQVSAQYFCRIKSGQMNFSNNPTFVSGSLNEIRHTSMKGNPTTFISQVQLYNNSGDMVGIGNLSTPLKKNFSSEATIKVKLTY